MASVAKRRWTKPDGSIGETWTVRYVDPGGKHRQSTFARKKEADAFRNKVESDTRMGMLAPDAQRVTVGQAIEGYMDSMEQRCRDGVIGRAHVTNTELILRRHVIPHLKNRKLAELNLAMLTDWHRDVMKAKKLSPFTGRMIARMLSCAMAFAMRREWVHRNPAALLVADLRGISPARVRTFSIDETKKVLLAANERRYRGVRPDAHLRLQCVVHLASFCGLRLGEIFGLRVEDIDFEGGVLNIRKSLSKHEGVKSPKSKAGVRTVAMPEHVAALLLAWIDQYQFANAGGAMFRAADGRAISMDGFRRGSWAALLDRAGFPRIGERPAFRIHALRHFTASWMIDTGWSLPEVAKTLGHAKVDMTMSVYAHALADKGASRPQMQALADRLLTHEVAH